VFDMPSKNNNSELLALKNVGQKTLEDLTLLGITTIQQLREQDPDALCRRLEQITGRHHDPCVWDVFAAIIHEAQTGEKTSWWQWTAQRKERRSTKSLCSHEMQDK